MAKPPSSRFRPSEESILVQKIRLRCESLYTEKACGQLDAIVLSRVPPESGLRR